MGSDARVRSVPLFGAGVRFSFETGTHVFSSHGRTFSLCQYPFLLSLGAKILLLTYDGEREMVERTNEAYRANLSSEETKSPLLVLNIRRDHLVADSLQQVRAFTYGPWKNRVFS